MREISTVLSSRLHRSCSVPGTGAGCARPVTSRISKSGLHVERLHVERRLTEAPQHQHPSDSGQDIRAELCRMHEELAQLRSEKHRQQEGLQAELVVAREEQQTLRAEIEEQSLSTVELPRLGRSGGEPEQQGSWLQEDLLPMPSEAEELMALRSELSTMSTLHERQKQDWQVEMAGARRGLEEALADQRRGEVLREELSEAREVAQAHGELQERLRSTCSELEEVKVERHDVHEELRRTRLELEALLETRQRQGVDLQGELLRVRSELSSLRQRQGQQRELQEELQKVQAERDRLARALREQGEARVDLEEELARMHGQLETSRSVHFQKVQGLQDELARTRSALDMLDEEKQHQVDSLQEELSAVRSELASRARREQPRPQSRPSLSQSKAGDSPTKPSWAQHPPSLPPPPTRRSLGCQADACPGDPDAPGDPAMDRTSDNLEAELQRVRAERDELSDRMKRQEVVQEAILHTCEELEQGYLATKRQHQDLRSELRRVCQERDSALKKLSADDVNEEDQKLNAALAKFIPQAALRGRSAPPTSALLELGLKPAAPPAATARAGGGGGDGGSGGRDREAAKPGQEEPPFGASPSRQRSPGTGAPSPSQTRGMRSTLSQGAAATAAAAAAAAEAAAGLAREACSTPKHGCRRSPGGSPAGSPPILGCRAATAVSELGAAGRASPPGSSRPGACGSADVAAGGARGAGAAGAPRGAAAAGAGRGGNISEALRRLQGLTDELLGPLAALAAQGAPAAGRGGPAEHLALATAPPALPAGSLQKVSVAHQPAGVSPICRSA